MSAALVDRNAFQQGNFDPKVAYLSQLLMDENYFKKRKLEGSGDGVWPCK